MSPRAALLALAALAACGGGRDAPRPRGVVLARVDGVEITEDVVRVTATRERVDARAALRMLVDEALLGAEARRRGLGGPSAEEDARWHALVRRLLEHEVEARGAFGAQPPGAFEEYAATRRAALCHDGLRRVVHAVFTSRAPEGSPARAALREGAEALRAAVVARFGASPTEAQFREAVTARGDRRASFESLNAFDRYGGVAVGGSYVPAFVRAVWTIPAEARLSGVFETSFGLHVALLVEEVPPSGVSCAEVRPRLIEEFEGRTRAQLAQSFVEQLRARANVRVDQAALRATGAISTR